MNEKPDISTLYQAALSALSRGQLQAAEDLLHRAIAMQPQYPSLHNMLAAVYIRQNRPGQAIHAIDECLRLAPSHFMAWLNKGIAFREIGEIDAAVSCFERAIELKPHFAAAHNHLAGALRLQARLSDAIGHYHRAVQLDPCDTVFHSNLIYALQFVDEDGAASAAEQSSWWQRHGTPHAQPVSFNNPPLRGRKLRLGYMSPNLSEHVIGRYLLPILRT